MSCSCINTLLIFRCWYHEKWFLSFLESMESISLKKFNLISEGAETTGTTQGRVPSNRECAQLPGSARTSSRRELRLQAPPRGGCSANGSVCTSSWRELRPQEPQRVRIKKGSACTPIAERKPTIKKQWVQAGNTRIPPGRGNPSTKESPTDNNRRRWKREWKSH